MKAVYYDKMSALNGAIMDMHQEEVYFFLKWWGQLVNIPNGFDKGDDTACAVELLQDLQPIMAAFSALYEKAVDAAGQTDNNQGQ